LKTVYRPTMVVFGRLVVLLQEMLQECDLTHDPESKI
jgi:hypothetical protein